MEYAAHVMTLIYAASSYAQDIYRFTRMAIDPEVCVWGTCLNMPRFVFHCAATARMQLNSSGKTVLWIPAWLTDRNLANISTRCSGLCQGQKVFWQSIWSKHWQGSYLLTKLVSRELSLLMQKPAEKPPLQLSSCLPLSSPLSPTFSCFHSSPGLPLNPISLSPPSLPLHRFP